MKLTFFILLWSPVLYAQGFYRSRLEERRILDSLTFFSLLKARSINVFSVHDSVEYDEVPLLPAKMNQVKTVLVSESTYLKGSTFKSCPSTADIGIKVQGAMEEEKSLLFSRSCGTVRIEGDNRLVQLSRQGTNHFYSIFEQDDSTLSLEFETATQLIILNLLLKLNDTESIRVLNQTNFFSKLKIKEDKATGKISNLDLSGDSIDVYDSLIRSDRLPTILYSKQKGILKIKKHHYEN